MIHGMVRTPAYSSWKHMKERVTNPNHVAFASYGGRGITICDRWMTFLGFFEDMGACPAGRSLDRIDNSKGYSKDNCRWATAAEQVQNRRTVKLNTDLVQEIRGRAETGESQASIARRLGVAPNTISRVVAGRTWR